MRHNRCVSPQSLPKLFICQKIYKNCKGLRLFGCGQLRWTEPLCVHHESMRGNLIKIPRKDLDISTLSNQTHHRFLISHHPFMSFHLFLAAWLIRVWCVAWWVTRSVWIGSRRVICIAFLRPGTQQPIGKGLTRWSCIYWTVLSSSQLAVLLHIFSP